MSQCPDNNLPEFAFIGRSNVGKSSLINYITGSGNLSKVSKTPGKTRLINHFLINGNFEKPVYFVDLPGYGYAKVSKEQRMNWGEFTEDFIQNRNQLSCVFSLIDASISPQKIDIQFTNWLFSSHQYFALVFTKTDKEKQSVIQKNIAQFRAELKKSIEQYHQIQDASEIDRIPIFEVSSNKKIGAKKLLECINELAS